MNEIKFLAFGDCQHQPGIFYPPVLPIVEQIKKHAIEENVDMCIHVGDFNHSPGRWTDVIDAYHAFPMPVYHTLGNHECDFGTYQDALQAYRLDNGYYYFERNGFRFVVLDTNYFIAGDKLVHYENRNYRLPEFKDSITVHNTLGKEQTDWMEQTIMDSPYPVVLISHASLERCYGETEFQMDELQRIWDLLDRVNADRQRVMMAINGHYHRDFLRIFKNIAFFDLNSTSFEWLDDAQPNYGPELKETYKYIDHEVAWDVPVHAIITLKEDGSIKIEGMKGHFLQGKSPKEVCGRYLIDYDGRPCTPDVLSCDIKINMNR